MYLDPATPSQEITMRSISTTIALLLVGVFCSLNSGCTVGPSKEQVMFAKAISTRVDRQPTPTDSARFFKNKFLTKRNNDYVMWSMDYASICMLGGNYDAAKNELLQCLIDIEKRQDTDKEKAAAASNESRKIFKGEPFERAMACTYLGMLHYLMGDYNNARIFCTRADMADATTEEDMKNYRHDFRLAHYWLGRSFLKLNKEGNARVAFKKAGQFVSRKTANRELKSLQKTQAKHRKKRIRLEKKCYQLATTKKDAIVPGVADMSPSPSVGQMPDHISDDAKPGNPVIVGSENIEQFLSLEYQKQVNLILVIETGRGPVKFLVGENGYADKIVRSGYPERKVLVYLDGNKAGQAFEMLDMFHQADTRGTSEKDRAQLSKGIAQAILSRIPYVRIVAAFWDVRADHRYWHLLPGEVHLFAAKVTPGVYTINLQCFDSNGHLIPRYSVTRYHIPVKDNEENIFFLHIKPEADNTYFAPKT